MVNWSLATYRLYYSSKLFHRSFSPLAGIVSNKKSYSREELKEALKHFKANMDDVKDEKVTFT